MSKAEDNKIDNNWSRQHCMYVGKDYSKQAIEMEDNEDPNQKKIDALWGSSAKHFFFALALGEYAAPRCLALAFDEGTGVKADKYMAAMLYGVALELKDPKCATTKNMPKIPKAMKPAITELAKLVKMAEAKIPSAGVGVDQFFAQLNFFNEKFTLLTGKFAMSCVFEQVKTQEDIAKFAVEHPGWVYHDDAYFQHLMDAADEGGAAAAGAPSYLADAFSSLHH